MSKKENVIIVFVLWLKRFFYSSEYKFITFVPSHAKNKSMLNGLYLIVCNHSVFFLFFLYIKIHVIYRDNLLRLQSNTSHHHMT